MHYTDPKVYEFISKQTSDPIVERKTCTVSGTKFPVYQSDLDFYKKISPTFVGQKFQIPTPTLCPEERERRRLSRRNERILYKRKCDATHKQIISIYKPDSPYTVYAADYRWGDGWNVLDYGFLFDENKSFTEQFDILLKTVPLLGLIGANNENSPYINLAADGKNCYMLIESSNCENCYHSYWLQKCTYCVDSSFSHSCEHCYEIDNCENGHGLAWTRDCKDCSDSCLLENCSNCHHCFGCVNQVNASYMIFNKKVTKDERQIFMNEFYTKQDSLLRIYKQQFSDLVLQYPKQAMRLKNTEQCFGHYLRDSKNCVFCVDGYDAENGKYGEHVRRNAKEVMDVSTVGRHAECIYESINTGIDTQQCMACVVCRSCHDMYYCYNCFHSDHCFGCVGLKNQHYCIFNKQYSAQEWEQEVGRIINAMQSSTSSDGQQIRGEFFPASLSPFCYNESCVMDQYPLTQEEVEARGLQRNEQETSVNLPDTATTIAAEDLPGLVSEVDESIVTKIIICSVSKKPYRIIKQELDFYRQHQIPLPRKHPDVRHQERVKKRGGSNLYIRKCDSTGEEMLSVYPQDVPFKVYAEEAYRKEVYG